MTDQAPVDAHVADPTPVPVADPVASGTTAPALAPTPAPTPAPVASGTPAPVADPAAAPPAAPTPEDWRTRESGGDAKRLKMLERYQSEQAWKESWFEQRKTLDTTRPKAALPDKPTPEQLTEWRAENGIPDAPEKYLENLPDGLVIGAEDKPIFDDFAKTLHANNLPPAAAHAAIEWYNQFQEKSQAAIMQVDTATAQATRDTLKAEWGPDYPANVNLRAASLARLPEATRDMFTKARLPDGTLLGEHADISKWLVGMEREINPVATIPPSGGVGINGKTIDDRLAEIKPMMGNYSSQYWKGERGADGKTSLEREYGQLLEAQQNLKKRGAA